MLAGKARRIDSDSLPFLGIHRNPGSSRPSLDNLDDTLKRSLRIRAAEHGRSMEEEAREILRQAVGRRAAPENLGEAIHRRFATMGGVDLDLPPREPMPAGDPLKGV